MSSNTNPIAIIPGHSFNAPYGARVAGLPAEYFYNRAVCSAFAWNACLNGFNQFVVLDDPAHYSAWADIGENHARLKALKSPFAIEVHFNSAEDTSINYAVAFVRRDNNVARTVANLLLARLSDGLRGKLNLSTYKLVELPNKDWQNLKAVNESPVPLVLIEPMFLTCPAAAQWLNKPQNIFYLGQLFEASARTALDSLDRMEGIQ